MRSSWKGIHPTWLSAYASLILGKRSSDFDHTQSLTEPCALCALSDIDTASGASGDVVGIDDDEPMCIDTVVFVSSHASHSTSHAPVYSDGKPSFDGFSLKAMAKLPFAAHRRTSAAAAPGSHSGTSVSGTRRPLPAPPHHSSIIQSL